jgi:hypothetical protein
MVKISEIVSQNPWWKHGEKFVIFDKNLKEAKEKPIFFERKRIDLLVSIGIIRQQFTITLKIKPKNQVVIS